MLINQLGLGGVKSYAAIVVTYPEGATCTATNGSKTLEPIGTTTTTFFVLPCAGEWTVSCTNSGGTETVSKSTEITYEGQVATLDLNFRLYIVKDNQLTNTDITGGITGTNYEDNEWGHTDSAGWYVKDNHGGVPYTRTVNKIDMSKYSLCSCTLSARSGYGNQRSVVCGVYSTTQDSPRLAYTDFACEYHGNEELYTWKTQTFDVSSLTQALYFGMSAYQSDGYLKECYFEPATG